MRVEVLANGKQRRHWSADDRTRIVAETSVAGTKVSDVARKHGIAPSLIFAWRREARGKELGEPAALWCQSNALRQVQPPRTRGRGDCGYYRQARQSSGPYYKIYSRKSRDHANW